MHNGQLRWHLPTPDADPVAKFLDNDTHPLYDRDAIDAAVAAERERAADDATPDQIIEIAEALQVRRILEEIKKVAALNPAADMPTPFQAAWQACCEEIFYRATGERWHMGEDAKKFKRPPATSLA